MYWAYQSWLNLARFRHCQHSQLPLGLAWSYYTIHLLHLHLKVLLFAAIWVTLVLLWRAVVVYMPCILVLPSMSYFLLYSVQKMCLQITLFLKKDIKEFVMHLCCLLGTWPSVHLFIQAWKEVINTAVIIIDDCWIRVLIWIVVCVALFCFLLIDLFNSALFVFSCNSLLIYLVCWCLPCLAVLANFLKLQRICIIFVFKVMLNIPNCGIIVLLYELNRMLFFVFYHCCFVTLGKK